VKREGTTNYKLRSQLLSSLTYEVLRKIVLATDQCCCCR